MRKSEVRGILTEREAKRLMTRAANGNANPGVCEFCQNLIQIGDSFVRKCRGGKVQRNGNLKRGVVRYYHERCWKSLLH